ncbi:MAG: ACT domain-containing protein [Proteobacteria bacterium]|nr:ACT domain-containing protein [Pseudomonadota bacterium]
MRVKQLSVFIENKEGRIAEVTSIIAEVNVNIRAISLADTSDFGVLRMIVSNADQARDALKKEGFTVGETDVVAVKVEDKPGGLNKILHLIESSGLNVEYMYSMARIIDNSAVMIFRFDKTDQAIDVLTKSGLPVINKNRVTDD